MFDPRACAGGVDLDEDREQCLRQVSGQLLPVVNLNRLLSLLDKQGLRQISGQLLPVVNLYSLLDNSKF